MSKDKAVSFETTRQVHDRCLCFAAQRAARALARRFDEALRPAGLTSGQFSLLMSLNQPEPPSLGAVARLLGMDRTTLTANLKPLVRRGRVQLAVDPDDRRGRLLVLTATGHELLKRALPIWRRSHQQVESHFAGRAVDALRSGLRVLS
ncbi:MAG TPA: MarR family winged helix-turn-helix transcriptional regulator [Reyranella sp.]|nr:MarR family winged helix-turn-helix transcriptional regulator [Reyranella sp.]